MNYKNYQKSRDAAWQILLDCGINRLPVDLNIVCRSLGIRVRSYAAFEAQEGALPAQCMQTDGLSFFAGEVPVILFHEKCTEGRIRFTVAHEIGHLVLQHVAPGEMTMINREPGKTDDPMERSANQFAARLLGPACVLWAMDLHTKEEIAEACHISLQAAGYRAERMQVLRGRNKFLSSALERRVYDQFRNFIQESQSHRRTD